MFKRSYFRDIERTQARSQVYVMDMRLDLYRKIYSGV